MKNAPLPNPVVFSFLSMGRWRAMSCIVCIGSLASLVIALPYIRQPVEGWYQALLFLAAAGSLLTLESVLRPILWCKYGLPADIYPRDPSEAEVLWAFVENNLREEVEKFLSLCAEEEGLKKTLEQQREALGSLPFTVTIDVSESLQLFRSQRASLQSKVRATNRALARTKCAVRLGKRQLFGKCRLLENIGALLTDFDINKLIDEVKKVRQKTA